MNVGIIGSGGVGRALGRGFAQAGHAVRLGTRSPEREELQTWAHETGAGAAIATFEETAVFGNLLVLSTLWTGTESALELAGLSNFSGKVVLDTTNPLDFSEGVPPRLFVPEAGSGGAQVQRWLPDARVVKCFNIVGAPFMVHPHFEGGPPTMFIAGDDADAKATTTEILDAFGWETIDLGGIEASAYLEGLAMVWILHGFKSGTWSHAFKLLRH